MIDCLSVARCERIPEMTSNPTLRSHDALASSGSGRIRACATWTALTVAVLAAIALLVPTQVAAGGHAATRTFDVGSVGPGGEVTVTIEATDFGPYGKVTETLPEGWTFLASDLPDSAVVGVGEFILVNFDEENPTLAKEDTVTFTYTLRAPDVPGVYTFEGVVEDSDREAEAVGGTGEVTVQLPPWPHCLRGDLTSGLSLVVYEGGAIEELDTCAASRAVTALYTLHDGAPTAYFPGAPAFLNEPFAALYPDGVPAFTVLIAAADRATGDRTGDLAAPDYWTRCLEGEIAAGFSLAVYAGGSVEELDACVSSRGVGAVYTLHRGDWVSYRPDGPEDGNRAFRRLFARGLPPVTPLLVEGDDPLPAAVETAARSLLAGKLDADATDVRLESSESVEWPDAGLGCPREDEAYAPVVTPGYRMTFVIAEASYAVHSNADGSHRKICEDDEQSAE